MEPGSYTLKYQLAGYQSASQDTSVSKSQFAELGTIRLAPLPDVGIISGTLTDTTTGQPLSGVLVEVTGAVTASALTDEQGYYAIVSPPGPVTVSAKLSGYDTLSGTGTVTRGVTLSFSPAINPTGTTPSNPEITVKGLIQDSETGTPLTDAIITIIGTEHSGQTDDTGAFEIPGVTAGELSLKIAIDGYQTGLFTVLAPPGGIVDLGTTHLPKTVAAATTTLIGQVKDANTGEPLFGASVSIETLESSALTAENGSYRLEEIDIKAFKITASALNYLTTHYNLNLSGSGVVTFDFNLTPAAESGLEIASISTEQTSYEALTAALLELVLNNKEDNEQEIRFLLKVLNEQGELVEQFSPVINNIVSVEANGQLNTTVEWQTARHQPGDYEVIVQAYHIETGQLLAERSTQVSIKPTKRIGGHVAFGPPIAQLAAKKPIKLTAQIANQGNQNVESTTVTATITLKNKGYQQQRSEVNIEPFVQENDLVKSPRGSDFDAAGNLYIANYSKHTVLKVTPEGEVSEFATDLHYPIDVDFDQFGNLYVLSYYSYGQKGLVRLGADGSRREFKFIEPANLS